MFFKKIINFNKNYFSLLITLIFCSLPLPFLFSNIFYFLLILYVFFYAIKFKVKPIFNRSNVLLIVLYSLMVLSYFWSIDKEATLVGLQLKSAFLILPFLFCFIPKFGKREIENIFMYFSLAMGVYALFFIIKGLVDYFLTGSLVNLTRHELVSPLNLNRIYVSLFTVTAIFNLVFHRKKELLHKILLGLLVSFLLLLSSKTIILTSFAVFIYFKRSYIIIRFKNQKVLFTIIFLIFSFIWFKYNPKFYTELIPKKISEVLTKKDFEKNYYFNGAELRILYIKFLCELEKEENIFFTGYGLNTSQVKINQKCVEYNLPDGYGTTYNFHNQYNQTLLELGVFGLVMLFIILFLAFKKALRNRSYFFITIFIIISILLLTESLFERQRGVYFFILLSCLLFHIKDDSKIVLE